MNSTAPAAPRDSSGAINSLAGAASRWWRKYPPGFRPRRGLNWGFLGLLYTSFYMCRYNFSIANKAISEEFGFSRADMGAIITIALLAYACGQIINGLLSDWLGGKRAMLIGATGTIIMNILFGAASMLGLFAPAYGSLGLQPTRPSVEFVAGDLKDVQSLLNRLRSDTNGVSPFLRTRLSEGTIQLVSLLTTNQPASPELRAALADDLNQIIKGENLYTTNRFAGVGLSRGATNLLAQVSSGPELIRLNRVLLDEAYPQQIRKSHQWLVRLPFLHAELFLGLLMLFIVIRGIDGYLQAFGAPGMTKIKAAWFAHRERGGFSGIFGFMINLGRFGIFTLGPALLAGFSILGLVHVPPLHWRWLFWTPSAICALVAVGMALTVKETPEEAGFHGVIPDDSGAAGSGVRAQAGLVIRTIASNPAVWITACAYACTGAVRQAVDQWFPRYMQELHHVDLQSTQFQFLAFLIPFVASAGSLIAGYVSDTLFKGRRTPVAMVLYFLETTIILLAAQFHTANAAVLFLVLISFTANSTHSILGSAVPMDIGGRRMAGFALGLIDSFQYFGGSLAGYMLGRLLDQSLGSYFYFMAPFGLIGGLLMLSIRGKISHGLKPAAPHTSARLRSPSVAHCRKGPGKAERSWH